jgi:HEAT repeat protein
MVTTNGIISAVYAIEALVVFLFGFILVYRTLKKVNLVEGEKFTIEDWFSCTAFGVMFALAISFALTLALEVFYDFTQPGADIPSIGGPILLTLLIILVIYPLWEIFFLARPTSDSVHELHKFLETRILDRFPGNIGYFISFIIFLIMYIVPVFLLHAVLNIIFPGVNVTEVAFIWFLLFPLFFLSYYAALGQISGIIKTRYVNDIPRRYIHEDKTILPILIKKLIGLIKVLIVLSPFILAIYNLYGPIDAVIKGEGFSGKSSSFAFISLFTTVFFGVKGFFKRFWTKKSKTKAIDFIFSGYIIIGIGINMMISFVTINPDIVIKFLGFEVFGFQPLIGIADLLNRYEIVMPLIVLQSIIIIFYGLKVFFNTKSELHADMRLAGTNKAFGLGIDQLMDREKREKTFKKGKFNLDVLCKSALLDPIFNKDGDDLNQVVRKKATQFLYLISIENKDLAKDIIDVITYNTIDRDVTKKEHFFLSKEAVDLLGFIGKVYPDLILKQLLNSFSLGDTQLQQFILDALGDIGESIENIKLVLKDVKPLLISDKYEVRAAAVQSITEMVTEGDYRSEQFVKIVLDTLYEVLDENGKIGRYAESTLECILNLCSKIPTKINIDKILPFIKYRESVDEDINGYVEQYAINIIGSIVYYNLDKFPLIDMAKYLKDERNYIRYVAADAIGNYILKKPNDSKTEEILKTLMALSLEDHDPDVTEMCAESVTEFLIMNKKYSVNIDGREQTILEYYTNALDSDSEKIKENASEAMKSIAPLFQDDIWPVMERKIQGDNLEVARDLMHTLALLENYIHDKVNLEILYEKTKSPDASTRAEALFALGGISLNRGDVDPKILIERLDDTDPQVRLEAIFALGKMGTKNYEKVVPTLLSKFFTIDRRSNNRITEVELYAESLGVIGEIYPSNEIIISLQQALMGDTNPYAKDVVARALWMIGNGMIKTGKATRRIESDDFYNTISWLQIAKKEYTIGNIIIMMIEAIQQKGIPESVMDILSDAMQDLLPVFVFVKDQKKPNLLLNTMKELLAQAYYSNYDDEILETIDRIDSLISFKNYFDTEDPDEKEQALFYSMQYTPDGKQFNDQGETFLELEYQDPKALDYALKSFEIAIDLSPNEYYSPNCNFQIGHILLRKKEYVKAKEKFKEALEIFASLDEIESMKKCDTQIKKIDKILNQ